ncbi:MAG: nucleotide exchange factor GrpE [Bacteroidetes bacterium]|jgi:molecular chaperone GrpE|nr:nucleotide exchange factor GrpE [Bacteroidota bacterium]MBT3751053.1 nucleotide exchange factor GrpE [Bacteroidota bacterium]MBT4400179.1 nucleotide exchange factor GrpE [Bacteroidota bacterium]MBT4410079.1 nucleotide exchange factor GrpE [Bacteroidota bacterium]MBT5426826.1 nucleotide exchange factor GrpE [Bacteroidota bacterium]
MEDKDDKTLEQEEAKKEATKEEPKSTKKVEKKESGTRKKTTSKRKASATTQLKKQLEESNIKLAEIHDRYLRLSAEYDNYRKRTLKEKMELTKTGGEQVLINILPVIDNLERAIGSVKEAKDVSAMKEGIELIYNKFVEYLSQNGVKEIAGIGEAFDTDKHEAITKIPAPSKELKGKVVDVIEKGYYLHDKIIRYSKVVIGE